MKENKEAEFFKERILGKKENKRNRRIWKRTVSLAVAFMMAATLANAAPVYAASDDAVNVFGFSEEETGQSEPESGDSQPGSSEDASQPAAAEATSQQEENAAYNAESQEAEEQQETDSISTLAYTSKDYEITVSFEKGTLPESAKLTAKEIREKGLFGIAGKEYKSCMEQAVEAVREDHKTVSAARFFDITFTDGRFGKEIEPEGPVDVHITYKNTEAPEDATEVKAVHLPENASAEVIDAKADENGVGFTADSFSVYGIVYTVDFWYGEYSFSIEGGSSILLSDVFRQLHMDVAVDDVINAKFSDESLVKVEQVSPETVASFIADARTAEEAYLMDDPEEMEDYEISDEDLPGFMTGNKGDWMLTSLQAFNTDETLTVELADRVIEIVVKDAQTVSVKEGEAKWYNDENITAMVPGSMTIPETTRTPSADSTLTEANGYKSGEKNSTDGYADSIWKKSSYNASTNSVEIETDYFRQVYTSKLDFIFVIDETGTMNKDVNVTINDTIYKASRAFWAREVALRASKFIFDWNDYSVTNLASDQNSEGTTKNTGFNNRTYYVSWGGSKYIKSGFKTSYADAHAWYEQNSKIVGGGTNHNTTATQIQPIINQSIADGRVPVVIYLSDFGSAMNSFSTASQQMLSKADVYPVLIYGNDSKSQSRRSKLNADTSQHYMMEDNNPISLLPIFGEIVNKAIRKVDPDTTITDELSANLTAAAGGTISYTSEGDTASGFKTGGTTSVSGSTATWKMNNGQDESGQIQRLTTDADSVYTSKITIPMDDNKVISGSMPTNGDMTVKDGKGNELNRISSADSPVIGKGVTFVLGLLDENENYTTNVVNGQSFTLTKTSGVGAGNGGTYTTSGSGSFTVPLTDAQFLPGDTYTLTQTSTNTDIAVMPDPATWTLTVNNDYTISASYSGTDAKLAMTASNGNFRIWNKSKANANTPLVPVVVKKVWSGYTATASDKITYKILGNDGSSGTIELPAYNGKDRTASGFAEDDYELTKNDKSSDVGNAEWTKTVYVPAYSGTGSAQVVFFDTTASGGGAYTNGYTVEEGDITTNAGTGSWETEVDTGGKTSAKSFTYYTYTGNNGWSPVDISSGTTLYRIKLDYADGTHEKNIYNNYVNFDGNAKSSLTGATSVTLYFTYTDSETHKIGNQAMMTLSHADDPINVVGYTWYSLVKIPTNWENFSFTKIEVNGFTLHDSSINMSYLEGQVDYSVDSRSFRDSHCRNVTDETLKRYEAVEPSPHTATGLQYPILQLTNTFTPSYNLTVAATFNDATPIEHVTATHDDSDHTKEQVQSVTFALLDDSESELQEITLDKEWDDSWTQGNPLNFTSQTVSLPAGSYTVKQKYYTIADGRKVQADSDGKFAAYNTTNGSQSITLGSSNASATASFSDTRLTHKVTVNTVWEYEEDKTKTMTYNDGSTDVTVTNEDIVIPFKIGTSIFRHHGTNSKAGNWTDVEDNVPSFGVDGYPIVCELDFDELETNAAYKSTHEVLNTFYTEITQNPKTITGTEDVTFTINIMRNRMPLIIKKTWVNIDGGTADGGNESVTVNIVKADTSEVVTPQYEDEPDIEITKDAGWKTTVYVPGGINYKVVEKEIGDTTYDTQFANASHYEAAYAYTDHYNNTDYVHVDQFDNEYADEEARSSYVPEAEITNTYYVNPREVNVHVVEVQKGSDGNPEYVLRDDTLMDSEKSQLSVDKSYTFSPMNQLPLKTTEQQNYTLAYIVKGSALPDSKELPTLTESTSTVFKDNNAHAANGLDGLRNTVEGVKYNVDSDGNSGTVLGTDEIYYIYYKSKIKVPVYYLKEENGTFTKIADTDLDYTADSQGNYQSGNARKEAEIVSTTSTQGGWLGNPEWAVKENGVGVQKSSYYYGAGSASTTPAKASDLYNPASIPTSGHGDVYISHRYNGLWTSDTETGTYVNRGYDLAIYIIYPETKIPAPTGVRTVILPFALIALAGAGIWLTMWRRRRV